MTTDTQVMNRSDSGEATEQSRRVTGSRIGLFAVDVAGLAAVLIWTLGPAQPATQTLAFAATYLFTLMFFLFLRPLLGASPSGSSRRIITDGIVLAALNAGVLVLVSRIVPAGPSWVAVVVVLAAAIVGTCGALLSRRSVYLAGILLLSTLPVVLWLGLEELAGVRADWLLAISPVGAGVITALRTGPTTLAASWMTLLAVVLLAGLLTTRLGGIRMGRSKVLSWLLVASVLSGLGAGVAQAQDSGATAKLELGVNGEIIAGAWNPARLMVTGIAKPMTLTLDIDGCVTHELEVVPDRWTEFLAFIPHEQPVLSLSGRDLAETAKSNLMPAGQLTEVGTEHWPGMVVTGGSSRENSGESPLKERARGVRFLDVELSELMKLPSMYLEQFPVVMLENGKVEGPPRKEFVRLTEWVSSRTLVIPPDSKVRRDWPGLAALTFEEVYRYEVLNRGLLDVLHHPRLLEVDPEIGFFGEGGDWHVRMQHAVLAACLGLLLVGGGFYVLMEVRLRGPLGAGVLAVIVVALIAGVAWVGLKAYEKTPVLSDVVLVETKSGSAVALETRFRRISGSPGGTYKVGQDAPAGWVPIYTSELQREANTLVVRQGKGEGIPEVAVKLATGSQVFLSTRCKLVVNSPTAAGAAEGIVDDEMLVRVAGGKWLLEGGRETETLNVGDYVRGRTGGQLDVRFLNWWAKRAPEGSHWRLRFSVEPGANGTAGAHVLALRVN